MAEYGPDTQYKIELRAISDIDEHGRGEGTAIVIGKGPKGTGWKATIGYVFDESSLRFRNVNVEPVGEQNVSSMLLREIPLGDIERYIREDFGEHPERLSRGAYLDSLDGTWKVIATDEVGQQIFDEVGQPVIDQVATEEAHRWLKEQAERAEQAVAMLKHSKSQRGSGALNDETLAYHSELYLRAFKKHHQKVVKGMMTQLSEDEEELFLTEDNLRWRTRKAKERGFLVSTGRQGQAGAKAGPALEKWRKEHPQ